MQFQTLAAQQLANLRPVDGVNQLTDALQQIEQNLLQCTPSSTEFIEFQTLKQVYLGYLDEAKSLRQKGMENFRKYLKNKNAQNAPITMPPPRHTQSNTHTNMNTNNTNMINDTHSTQSPPTAHHHSESHNHNHDHSHNNDSHNHNHTMTDHNNTTNIGNSNMTDMGNGNMTDTQRDNELSDKNNEIARLTAQNSKMAETIAILQKEKVDLEENENEYLLLMETYKFEKISSEQEISSLKQTLKSKNNALHAMNSEFSNLKQKNGRILQKISNLEKEILDLNGTNTNLKEKLIENESNYHRTLNENLDLNRKCKEFENDGKCNEKEIGNDGIYERLLRVHSMVANDSNNSGSSNNALLLRELSALAEQCHPMQSVVSPSIDSAIGEGGTTGNAISISELEYREIESVISERDSLLNRISFYEESLQKLNSANVLLQKRISLENEERSLMMQTLKESVNNLSVLNYEYRNQNSEFSSAEYSMKENQLKQENEYYRICDENRERKVVILEMSDELDALKASIATYTFAISEFKKDRISMRNDLNDSLERNQKLMQEKEILSHKLRENDKLIADLLNARSSNENESNSKSDFDFEICSSKMDLERMLDASDGRVNDLTNQVIELENNYRETTLENEFLKKRIELIENENAKKTNQIRSAQRVALSIIGQRSSNDASYSPNNNENNKDIFGLLPPPKPDLITNLLAYLLPFLFDDDEMPKIV